MSVAIQFRFSLGEMVNCSEINSDDQHFDGYEIVQRFVRQRRPAYRLAGAFFAAKNYSNVFYEIELISHEEMLELIREFNDPWSSFDDDYDNDSNKENKSNVGN